MSTEIEALEQFYAAINRNDMQAITKDFDPQIVRMEPEGFPTTGTYRGIAAVQEHITKGRGYLGRRNLPAREVPGEWRQSCRVPPCLGPLKGLD
jgi:ketosteroid isomerase-like protein